MTNSDITNIINQMLIFLDNKSSMSDIVYPDFHKAFNPNIDYRAQYYKVVANYNTEYSAEHAKCILNKENEIEPTIHSNDEISFDKHRINMGISWGYGTYFDGESVELSEKEKEKLIETQEIVSKFIGADVIIQDDVDVDFEDDLFVNVLVTNIPDTKERYRDELGQEELMIFDYDEICHCGEDIYSCDCDQE